MGRADWSDTDEIEQPGADRTHALVELALERLRFLVGQAHTSGAASQREQYRLALSVDGAAGTQPPTALDQRRVGQPRKRPAHRVGCGQYERTQLIEPVAPLVDGSLTRDQQHAQPLTRPGSARLTSSLIGEQCPCGAQRVEAVVFQAAVAAA